MEKTIAAISTAPAPGGIGIVRISGGEAFAVAEKVFRGCLLYTSPSPRDKRQSRMPSSA